MCGLSKYNTSMLHIASLKNKSSFEPYVGFDLHIMYQSWKGLGLFPCEFGTGFIENLHRAVSVAWQGGA